MTPIDGPIFCIPQWCVDSVMSNGPDDYVFVKDGAFIRESDVIIPNRAAFIPMEDPDGEA